eukprot:g15273.t1
MTTMSVVKTVKGRKALLTALEQTPKDKLRWWDHKQRILENWLDTSGDEITVEGASELIRGQLQRGNAHEYLRIKCWKHIVIELSALVEDDSAPSNGAASIMGGRRGSSQRPSLPSPSSDDQDNDGTVDLAGLSFVERQEEWLRRKQTSLRAKTHEVERAVKNAATFNPNLAISQSSLRPAQVSAVELKLEEMANEAERHARRSSFSQSIQEAKRRAEREALPASNVSGGRRRSRMKRRGSTEEDPMNVRRATAPPEVFQARDDVMGHLNPAGDGTSDDDLDDAEDSNNNNNNNNNRSVGVDEDREVEEKEEAEGEEDDGEPPFEKGSFFFKVDDKDKGHYKVRDVSCFLLTSMYKRKDRVTRTPGVSLLVGKLEDPPHEEKVISALFDTDRFTEKAAAQWWEDNGHRFEDARSLAAKKELDDDRRRTMERNVEVLRRASAPARASANDKQAIRRNQMLLKWISVAALATIGVEHAGGIAGGGIAKIASSSTARRNVAMAAEQHPTSNSNMTGQDCNDEGEQQQQQRQQQQHRDISLCLLLIVRDEEESLQKNLPLWRKVADCFVIGVDDRTTDRSVATIHDVIGDGTARFVFFFSFQDFAQARNAVLRSTAHNFPDCSHVIIADADWRPELETIDKSELDFGHVSFPFLVWDHSGHTSRLVGWLLRFDEDLRFKYRVHEVLDTRALPSKLVGWEVRVLESGSNWNANLHQHSRSSERFLFDLKLLEMDYLDDPTDLHTLYYLGITTFAYLESLVGKGTHENTPELQALVAGGMSYLGQAIDLHGDMKNSELVWGSKRWLAYGYHFFIGDKEKAEAAYEACLDYDPARVDCVAFLSRLYLADGDLDAAWRKAKTALLHRPAAGVLTYFYTYECFVPTQAAIVISKRISGSGDIGNDSLEGLLTLGSYLVRHHRDVCKHGVMVDSPEDIERLEAWFDEAIEREAIDVEEIRRATLNDGDSLMALLLRMWGTGMKASSAWHEQVQQQAQQLREQRQLQEQKDASESQQQEKSSSGTMAPLTSESCAKMVDEVTARMELGVQMAPGALVPARLADIDAVLSTTRFAEGGPIRAMIFCGVGGATADDNHGGGLEHEELLRVVSLMLQMRSFPARSELTYASPKSSAVEAARSVASSCANEIGIADGRVRVDFVRSTLDDLLLLPVRDQLFDYVDVGGPLSGGTAGGKNGNDSNTTVDPGAVADDADVDAAALDSETLMLLGEKLAPGGCLRAWAFASNPFTELAFRAAARTRAPAARGESGQAGSCSLSAVGECPEQQGGHNGLVAGLVDKVIRTTFGAARNDPMPMLAGADDEDWVRQAASKVLAGGDRLSVPNIDEVLARGGFELALRLGENATEPGGLAPAGAACLAGMEEELVDGGLSRWEISDFADFLEATPKLMHQFLAVWRGGGSNVAMSR